MRHWEGLRRPTWGQVCFPSYCSFALYEVDQASAGMAATRETCFGSTPQYVGILSRDIFSLETMGQLGSSSFRQQTLESVVR